MLPLEGVDPERWPRLAWRWRILQGLEVPDERVKAGDDFAARVYVLFDFDPARESWLGRAQRRLAEARFGEDLPWETLSYVWASGAERGAEWVSPYTDRAHVVVLQTGSARAPAQGGWRQQVVDFRADARRLLGEPLPPLRGIALMTDSDQSCAEASAEFADFRLLGP